VYRRDCRNVVAFSQGIFYPYYKPIYAYLPMFTGSWNMQEHWDSDLFGSVTAEIMGVFRHFALCSSGTNLAAFLLYLRTTFFEAHLLSS